MPIEVDGQKSDWDFFGEMKAFIGILLFIAAFFSRTVEVFLRQDFGERYLHFESIIITFIVLNIMTGFTNSIDVMSGTVSVSSGLLLFAYAFLIVGALHKFKIIRRNYAGDASVHSYSFGKQWGIWNKIFPPSGFLQKMFPIFTHRFAEPALVFALGIVATGFDASLGAFLMFAAICLMISMHTYYKVLMTQLLDKNDARLEAEGNKTGHFGDVSLRPAVGKPSAGKPTQWDDKQPTSGRPAEQPIGMSEQMGQAENLTTKTSPPEAKPTQPTSGETAKTASTKKPTARRPDWT